ncbi:MAG: Ig-like domain-containing protein [Candidatus Nanoarchaeia archaeon]|nr:Ig-like domain-containing protein [Candidatus Nanoarchaeia archaeon]
MRLNQNRTLIFIYITIILTTALSVITLINESPYFFQQITGKPVGIVGICISEVPIFSNIENQTGNVDIAFYYDINATASATSVLEFSDNSSIFNIDASTGEISFTPASADQGYHWITVWVNNTVCDTNNSYVSAEFTLNISAGAPVLDPIGDLTANEDEEFYLELNATDPNSEALTFASDSTIFTISSTGIINFTPTNSEVGSYNITINVTNVAGLYDWEAINFTVLNVNDAPILDIIPNFTVENSKELYEDQAFEYDVNATDPEGDTVYFYDNSSMFVINENDGFIRFTPTQEDVGNYSIEIYAVDGSLLDSQVVLFEIIEVNEAPVLDAIGAKTVEINSSLEFKVYAIDEEEDYPLTFSSDNPILNLTAINNTAASVSHTYSENGTYTINISVNDSTGLVDSEVISLAITNINHAPVIDDYSPISLTQSMDEGSSKTFNITYSDEDGNIPSVQWYLDNSVQTGEINDAYTYSPNYNSQGIHTIMAMISDGLLTANTTWTVTVNDVVVTPSSGGGGGGGGGGTGGAKCGEQWSCSDWSPCQNAGLYLQQNYYKGFQLRRCVDLKNCGSAFDKPREEQECAYVPFETCFDNIKNQNEILPDCGGICKACPTCDDGTLNQKEQEVDCGGPCKPCLLPQKPTTFCGDGKIFFIEIFTCPGDTWFIWIILIALVLAIIYTTKHKKKPVEISSARKQSEKERYERIKELYHIARVSAHQKNYTKAKITCDRIEMIYSGISPGTRFKRKSLRLIKRLNRILNRLFKKV